MRRTVALSLALALTVFVLAGCGGTESEKLVGTWEGQLDLTAVIRQQVPETMQDLDVGEFVVTAVFTFTEDGAYTMGLDEASMTRAVEAFVEKLEAYVIEKLEAAAKEQELTAEQAAQMLGMTPEEYAKKLLEKADVETLAAKVTAGAEAEGRFEAKDGRLFLSESPDAQPNEAVYSTYTLEGDVLTITAATGGSETETNLLKLVYPIILKKTPAES